MTASEVVDQIVEQDAPVLPAHRPALPIGDELTEMVRIAKAMVASEYFRDAATVAQAVVKMLAGKELGIPPVASMQGVYIVRGRISLSSNVIGALIKRSGKYNYLVKKLTNAECEIEFYERDYSTNIWRHSGTSSFSVDDAKRAGIVRSGRDGDGPWITHPRNMLFARALTNGARWFCPDCFNGPISTPEELQSPGDEQEPTLAQEESSASSSDNAEN